MEARLGRSEYLLIWDDEAQRLESFDNGQSEDDACGAGPKMAKTLLDLKIDVVITGNGPGENASVILEKSGIKIYVGAADITAKEALLAYQEGKLRLF